MVDFVFGSNLLFHESSYSSSKTLTFLMIVCFVSFRFSAYFDFAETTFVSTFFSIQYLSILINWYMILRNVKVNINPMIDQVIMMVTYPKALYVSNPIGITL